MKHLTVCGGNKFHIPECSGSLHIEGADNVTINQGVGIDLAEGVSAYDSDGDEISFEFSPTEIEPCDVGEHEVIYTAVGKDEGGNIHVCGRPALFINDSCDEGMVTAKRIVTIEQADDPTIEGINDIIVAPGTTVDLMNGVTGVDDNGNTTEVEFGGGIYDDKAEGEVAVFDTDLTLPMKSLTADIDPIQEGTPWNASEADTTPYNIRQVPSVGHSINSEYDSIVGASVAWNQVCPSTPTVTRNGVTFTNNDDGSYTINGTSTATGGQTGTRNFRAQYNHKYLFVGGDDNLRVQLYPVPSLGSTFSPNTAQYGSAVINCTNEGNSAEGFNCVAIFGILTNGQTVTNLTIKPMLFDLTALFSNTPTIADYVYSLEQATSGAGVAWLKEYFPKMFTEYQPYNAGEIKSVEGLSAHVMRDADDEIIGNYALDSDVVLRGIPKLSNGNLYYDGDTYKADGTVTRKYGIVDLGTLTWVYISSYGTQSESIFKSNTISDFINSHIGDLSSLPHMVCARYALINPNMQYTVSSNKSITAYTANATNTGAYLLIRDFTYSSASAFKTAMSGVYLVYELATPTTESADPYTSPQSVDADGTEEYVSTGILPVGHETWYADIYPISGWDAVNVYVSPTSDAEDGQTYTEQLGRTVYGGTLDLVSGLLTVDRAMVDLGSLHWGMTAGTYNRFYSTDIRTLVKAPPTTAALPNLVSDRYTIVSQTDVLSDSYNKVIGLNYSGSNVAGRFNICDSSYSNATEFTSAMSGVPLVYELATPQTYQLTPHDINTLLGYNRVWADSGDVAVVYTKSMEGDDITFNVEGEFTVTYTTEDECGNETTEERTIYVQTTMYRFEGLTDATIPQGTDFDLTDGVTAYDAQGNPVPYTVTPNDIDTCDVGTHSFTYAIDSVLTASRTVTVVAIDDPTITGVSETLTVEPGEEFDPLDGVRGFDGNGNRITVDVSVSGKRTVIYTDGTLIINESLNDSEANEAVHGEALYVYEPMEDDGSNYVWTSSPETLWHSTFDEQYAIKSVEIGTVMSPISTAYWFNNLRYCTSLDLDKLDTSRVTDMKRMFAYIGYQGGIADPLDLTMFDTSNVTNMDYMFNHCMTTFIDASSFDTSSLTDASHMFSYCNKLTTICASDDFVVDQIQNSYNMLYDCYLLVGGMGTTFEYSNPNDKTYAHIDGGENNPGYFTDCSDNLIPYPWYDTTKTVNGITFTDNGDGTLTIDGTSTGSASFTLVDSSDAITLNVGDYLLKATGNADVNINVMSLYDGSSIYVYTANENDAQFTPSDSRRYNVSIGIVAGVTVSNLTIRPKLLED